MESVKGLYEIGRKYHGRYEDDCEIVVYYNKETGKIEHDWWGTCAGSSAPRKGECGIETAIANNLVPQEEVDNAIKEFVEFPTFEEFEKGVKEQLGGVSFCLFEENYIDPMLSWNDRGRKQAYALPVVYGKRQEKGEYVAKFSKVMGCYFDGYYAHQNVNTKYAMLNDRGDINLTNSYPSIDVEGVLAKVDIQEFYNEMSKGVLAMLENDIATDDSFYGYYFHTNKLAYFVSHLLIKFKTWDHYDKAKDAFDTYIMELKEKRESKRREKAMREHWDGLYEWCKKTKPELSEEELKEWCEKILYKKYIAD